MIRFLTFLFLYNVCVGQNTHHWETMIYNTDTWKYTAETNHVSDDWIYNDFTDNNWEESVGGIGYGDNDDNTIIDETISLYMRKNFEVEDSSMLVNFVLHADYDDSFVAYINGEEIARSNIGTKGVRPDYDDTASQPKEAQMYQGGNPEVYIIEKSKLENVIVEGENILAIEVHNYSKESSDLSSNFFLSVGIRDNSIFYRPTPVWFGDTFFKSRLPIIKILTLDGLAIVNEPRVEAQMGIIYNGEDRENAEIDFYNEYKGRISIELRGTSSLFFEKKGYGFETQNSDGSNKNITLLGMPKENDWVFHGPYSDKSLIRNVLAYHLGSLTNGYSPRTRFCELFINDEYLGVYVLTEKIKQDKNRVDISKLRKEENSGDDLTGGYIIKIDRNDENIPDIGWYSTFPDNKFYAYVEPQSDEITPAQKNYIQEYIYSFESAMWESNFENVYGEFIDLDSWVDYFLVTEITKHIDAYKLSYYMYKDKDSKGGKLHMGPLWDFNLGFGNFDFSCSPSADGWAYEFWQCGSWHPFWVRKIIGIENVQHLTKCRWEELREGPFRTDSLLNYINNQVVYLGEAVERNFERWPVLGVYLWPNNFVGNTYQGEVNFLKNWLISRLNWIDNNLPGDCDLFISDILENDNNGFLINPNPIHDFFSIRMDQFEPGSVVVYNIHGREIVRKDISKPSDLNHINLPEIKSGVYYLYYLSDDKMLHRDKIVIGR